MRIVRGYCLMIVHCATHRLDVDVRAEVFRRLVQSAHRFRIAPIGQEEVRPRHVQRRAFNIDDKLVLYYTSL